MRPLDPRIKRTPVSVDEMRERVTPDKLGIVGMFDPPRPGCRSFCVFLEYRHFSPWDKPLNEKFEMSLIPGPDEVVFFLVLVPQSYREAVRKIAWECKLRLADGIPHVGSSKGWWHFPIDKPNVFSLETLANSFVYMNNDELYKAAMEVEQRKIDAEIESYDRRHAGYK